MIFNFLVIEKQDPKVEPENSRDQPYSIQVFKLKKSI